MCILFATIPRNSANRSALLACTNAHQPQTAEMVALARLLGASPLSYAALSSPSTSYLPQAAYSLRCQQFGRLAMWQRLQGQGSRHRRAAPHAQGSSSTAATPALQQQLQELDKLLAAGEGTQAEAQATRLAASLAKEGSLRAYGKARQVPKRTYTMEELRLNKIQPEQFLAPKDSTLSSVRNMVQGSYLAGLTAAYFAQALDLSQIVQVVVVTAFLLTVDQVANAGGVEALLIDSAGRLVSGTYERRVALHEAGHFLIAYLLGLLPRGYTLSSLDLFLRTRQLNVQAGCQFCDSAFQTEVASGRLSSGSLDVYVCVALAGVATEWLRFGHAEGGMADVQQLDRLLQALSFTQAKVDAQVRWAVLNVVTLLRRHKRVHDELAVAMQRGDSVGQCINVIEAQLADSEDI